MISWALDYFVGIFYPSFWPLRTSSNVSCKYDLFWFTISNPIKINIKLIYYVFERFHFSWESLPALKDKKVFSYFPFHQSFERLRKLLSNQLKKRVLLLNLHIHFHSFTSLPWKYIEIKVFMKSHSYSHTTAYLQSLYSSAASNDLFKKVLPYVKVHIFWEGHKVLRNLPLTFDHSTYNQK